MHEGARARAACAGEGAGAGEGRGREAIVYHCGGDGRSRANVDRPTAAPLSRGAACVMRTRTCKWFELCPMKRFLEEGRLDRFWTDHYCHGDWVRCVRYQMEERGEDHPDWMLPDGTLAAELR